MPPQRDPNEPKRCIACDDTKQCDSGTLDKRTGVQVCDYCLSDGTAVEKATELRQMANSIIRMERSYNRSYIRTRSTSDAQ